MNKFTTNFLHSPTRKVLLLLFVFHCIFSTLWLHRIPGLLGDEGSEGENVYQILNTKQFTVVGERSYIGPAIDYLRLPFIHIVGYNALALRILVALASLIAFGLAWSVFRHWFTESAALYIVAFMFFSPAYILQQRLGWAITLIPFCILLLLWVLQQRSTFRPLIAGLVGGLSLSNHFIFLPSLIAVSLFPIVATLRSRRGLRTLLLAVIGFWAAFGTQFTVLQLQPEDQGEPKEVLAVATARLATLPDVVPGLLAGSTYSALYTGNHYSPLLLGSVLAVVTIGIILALALPGGRKYVWIWFLASFLQLGLLLLIVDRHAVRYYVPLVLSMWGLSGVGFYKLTKVLPKQYSRALPVLVVILLLGVLTFFLSLGPYLKSGGSLAAIELHPGRSESAAAYVDVRPLVSCVQSAGLVSSENVHIYNRLLYLSRGDDSIRVTDEPDKAAWIIDYRLTQNIPNERCPSLTHFQVVPNHKTSE